MIKIRTFTLLPRRFQSHYWDVIGRLHFTKWWQWGTRCFFIRDRIIVRPTFLNWEQIGKLSSLQDKNPRIIWRCISKLNDQAIYNDYTPQEIYEEMVEHAKQPN